MKCHVCDKEFSYVPGGRPRKYCSRACFYIGYRKTPPGIMNCEICGKTFTFNRSKRPSRRFCSNECKAEWRRVSPPVLFVCEVCGKEFRAYASGGRKRRFCSHACRAVAIRGPRVARPVILCPICGRLFPLRRPSDHQKFCSRQCYAQSHRKPDSDAEVRPRFRFKESVAELFGNPCAVCGYDGMINDACHIVPASQGGPGTMDNAVKLCVRCHRELDRGVLPLDEVLTARDAILFGSS